MTATEHTVVAHALSRIEPALTPGSEAHANFLVLRGILNESHAGAPKTRGRRRKATGEMDTASPP